MLATLDRYLLTETFKAFAAIVTVLLLTSLSLLLLRTLEEVDLGALGTHVAWRYLGYQLLRDSVHLLPPAFFLAVLTALGRMARDSELIALHACGIGPGRLYRALLYGAMPLIVLTAWLALVAQPHAAAQIQTIRALQQQHATQIAGLRAGRYYRQEHGAIVFYAGSIDDNRSFREIFLHDRRAPRTRIVIARSGYYSEVPETGERFIVLEDGRRYEGQPGAADFTVGTFTRYWLRLEDSAPPLLHRKRSATPTAELRPATVADRVELEHRVAQPLAIVALLLIAVPLALISPRQGAGARLVLAFLAYFAFFNLQRLAEGWLLTGVTPPWLGSLWYQAVIVALVFAALVPGSFWPRRWYRYLRCVYLRPC